MTENDNGHLVDPENWKRREHFELYREAWQPFFNISVDVDVTSLWRRAAAVKEGSFFLGGLFALLRATNAIEPLRLRLRGDKVWLHKQIGVGTTILKADETFGFVRFDPAATYDEFRRRCAPIVERAKASAALDPMRDRDDILYHTTIPWLRFTGCSNALSGKDSIPRVAFGKVFAVGSGFRMPVAVEAHHALVDGLDVARFVETLESEMMSVDLGEVPGISI
jgi:chloramphenicol O-acetyltransferase type A